jgi:hypothetical protein
LIAQAQQNAAGLEAALQAQSPASLETATALLKERYDAESAARGRRAGEGLAARRATELTAEDRAAFTPTGRLSKAEVAQAAERAVSDPKTTPEKAAAIASYVEKQLGSDYKGLERIKGRLRAPAAAGGARAQAPGVRAMTPQEAAREETLNQLFETTYFDGPSGIVGGFDGKAVADARAQTQAPAGTGFATAEDAFVAALAGLRELLVPDLPLPLTPSAFGASAAARTVAAARTEPSLPLRSPSPPLSFEPPAPPPPQPIATKSATESTRKTSPIAVVAV